MKKLICLTICMMFIISSFSGCNQATTPTETSTIGKPTETVRDYVADPPSEKCSIEKIGDNYYLFIEDIEYYEKHGSDDHLGTNFYSFEEFRDALVNCNLNRSKLDTAATDFERDDIGIKICDPYNIYIPSLPENLKLEDQITWHGEFYNYYFIEKNDDNTGVGGGISYCSQERLNRLYEEKKADIAHREDCKLYTISNADKQIKVVETLGIMEMYVFEKEIFYYVQLLHSDYSFNIDEWRPSEDWLLSIGMTKYVEPEAPDET